MVVGRRQGIEGGRGQGGWREVRGGGVVRQGRERGVGVDAGSEPSQTKTSTEGVWMDSRDKRRSARGGKGGGGKGNSKQVEKKEEEEMLKLY